MFMRSVLTLILAALSVFSANAHVPDSLDNREKVLSEARYLKSIFKTDEAVEKLSALVGQTAFDEDALFELADCHFQRGDYESAAATYSLLSANAPGNILYKIRQLEQSDSAIWYYRRSLAIKPHNETVVAKAVNVLIGKADYDGAIYLTEEFLADDPDNSQIAPLQGVSYYRKGDHDSAINVFQRQEDIGNDSYPIHFYLGQCYWHTNVLYRAEEELLAAWQIDSSDVNLAYSIAAVKSDAYKSFEKEVKPWLDKAVAMLQPDAQTMSRIHQYYGLGYYRTMKSWDQAIGHYKEAYRYNPNFISAISTIAYCYEQKKDYKQALAWYEKYLKVATPESKGYVFAVESVRYLKGELFMEGEAE